MFRDRTQAGAALAAALPEYRRKSNVTVIGLARGGVEVAAELARLLDQPLDVLCVRKVSMPGHQELAMGAVAPMGERFTNRRLAARLTASEIDAAYDAATAAAREMDDRLRGGVPMMLIGRVALLVDDGAATGASVRAALAAGADRGQGGSDDLRGPERRRSPNGHRPARPAPSGRRAPGARVRPARGAP